MKRFYETVNVKEAANGFAVQLDAHLLKTPAKKTLYCPTQNLAQLVADEWAAQSATIQPDLMPIMRLVATALDRVQTMPHESAEAFAAYGLSDLLCYRATHPEKLVARQAASWSPLLDWARARFGLVLGVTSGIVPVAQPSDTKARLAAVAGDDIFRLTGLAFGAPLLGSAIVTLALAEAEINAETAYETSQLDDIFQMEEWGRDVEIAERLSRRHAEIAALGCYFAAIADKVADKNAVQKS